MSSLVSIRLNDSLRDAMHANARLLHLTQTDYIRMAIEHMNTEIEKQAKEERLKNISLRVRQQSMQVNEEFSGIEHDPKD